MHGLPPGLTLTALGRSPLALAGLLLLAVGLGDAIAGRTKMAQYEELLQTTGVPAPADPAALFPTATERQERYDLARAKVAFYHLLVTVGQVFCAAGLVLIAYAVVRLRARPLHAATDPPLSPPSSH